MSKLPFVVQPQRESVLERVGNERCGVLEIERKGFLTTGEMAFVQQQTAKDSSTEMILSLVRKVAAKFKIDAQKAYEAVTAAITNGASTAVSRKVSEVYASEITEITQALIAQEHQKRLVCAYALIVYRVSEDFAIEEFMELDPELIDAVYELYEKEESRLAEDIVNNSEEDETEQASDVEELEKK